MITITEDRFGTLPDGRPARRWTVRDASGAGFTAMELGATILTLDVPDRHGALGDVVLGFDDPVQYLTDSP